MQRNLTSSQFCSVSSSSCSQRSTSHFLSTLLNDSHLCPPLPNSSQLVLTHLTSVLFRFLSARSNWHKCNFFQLPSPSLDPFDSFNLCLSYFQGTLTSVQLSIVLSRFFRSSSPFNSQCRNWVAKHSRSTRSRIRNCSSKTGSRRQSGKRTILMYFFPKQHVYTEGFLR